MVLRVSSIFFMPITSTYYLSLEQVFGVLNETLFDKRLPDVLLTMQRRNSHGYFAPKRFQHRQQGEMMVDEIALNPDRFDREDVDILAAFAHDLCHLWQQYYGKPGRKGYHNREWADKMIEIGLMPSHTGQPDGKQTGQRMSHYLLAGGRFERAMASLFTESHISWKSQSQGEGARRIRQTRQKYTCPGCGLNVWAKPAANIVCGDCQRVCETA
ncbi:putative zinc metallopeptidase [Candidatus Moduliflexus flocculans]|uniref:Putative zinc metallopeptidase n=1 Tax=Candidatus Moduliflexus flocculans TaxID=1499966 RepID=A0A0S6VWQ1_9BACT|nr:putative zinc metallopeptidase [Candidatus Moduliflexus flocculans]